MTLLINASMLGDKPTGLGVYSENCISGVSKKIQSSLISSRNFSVDAPIEIRPPENISIGSGVLSSLRRILWLQKTNIDRNRLIYSPTHHGFPTHKNQIITIHDLICLKFPAQHILQYLYFKLILPRAIKKSRAIFTVSNASKEDIARTYSYPSEKIFVVPNGVDTKKFKMKSEYKKQPPFLLMVGARYPHKNVNEVLDNSDLWSKKYRLVIASCHGRYRRKLQSIIAKKNIGDKVTFLDYVPFDELVSLYQDCSALIYPSMWEGFGIPPLEAIACGAPVIASDIPVHKEVLGDAAFFITIGKSTSWEKAFKGLGDSEKVRRKLEVGRERLAVYTWEKSVETLTQSLLAVEPNLSKIIKLKEIQETV